MDFRISHSTLGASSSILGGTLGFAAPEQIDPAFGTIGPRTDIYAIGGLVHWHLFGKPPHDGVGTGERLNDTTSSGLGRDLANTQTDSPLQAIMQTTLISSPTERLPTVEDIIQLLAAPSDS